MPNKTTVALSQDQYENIISTMKSGTASFRPNEKIATALVMEANLGMRIKDILLLKPSGIIKDGDRYRLNVVEEKTGKKRTFTVQMAIYNYLRLYVMENKIGDDDLIFPISERAVQKHLKKVCDYLGYKDIGTHSFRKFFATEIYKNNDYNIVLVQKLLQHSNAAITQRYIGMSTPEVEAALQKHIKLL